MIGAEGFENLAPILLGDRCQIGEGARLVIANQPGSHGALYHALGADLPLAPLALERGLVGGHELGRPRQSRQRHLLMRWAA